MQSRRDDDRRWPEQWEEAPLRRASYEEPGIQRRTTSQARTQRSAADRYDASDGYRRATSRYGDEYRRPASRYDEDYRRPASRYDDEYRRPASRYDDKYRRPASRYDEDYRRATSRYDDEYLRPANRYDDEYRRPAGGNGRAAARRRPYRSGRGARWGLIAALAGCAAMLVLLLLAVIPRRPAPDVSAVNPTVQTEAPLPTATALPTAPPTMEPTAEPTAEPLPAARMSAEYQLLEGIPNTDRALGLPEGARVDDSYFNDAVFVGDSVSEKLKYFVASERKGENPTLLGNAVFLTAPSFSARNALKDVTESSLHPTYQGQKMKVEDIVALSGMKKVYIMLGLNDVGISGVDRSVENMIALLEAIKAKSPDVQIFVQSATPRLSGSNPTTAELFQFDLKLYDYCLQMQDQGIYYVDVAYIMRDASGKLYQEYCSDADSMALHFNNTACRKWVEYLYTHTA